MTKTAFCILAVLCLLIGTTASVSELPYYHIWGLQVSGALAFILGWNLNVVWR